MIVPQYWAEGRLRRREGGRQVTVRRFGWSDESQEEAQRIADARTAEALERVWSGENLDRREVKVPYNGAEGHPIREEILSRHGDTIITRNSYGAHCLNTPSILFADIDFTQPDTGAAGCFGCSLSLIAAAVLCVQGRLVEACVAFVIGALCGLFSALPLPRLLQWVKGDPMAHARKRVTAFLESHPEWHLRLYRTPAGLRVLVLHRPFDPGEPAVSEFFRAIRADPMYVRMCQRQRCFRARVSPKPWRMGIDSHLRPRPGVWPVHPDRMDLRTEWVENYEAAASGYASCRFLERVGADTVHPEAREVQQLHDRMCRAIEELPLA